MINFDIILRVDWLHSYYALIDGKTRIGHLHISDKQILELKSSGLAPSGRFISYLKARKIISKVYINHLVRVKHTSFET